MSVYHRLKLLKHVAIASLNTYLSHMFYMKARAAGRGRHACVTQAKLLLTLACTPAPRILVTLSKAVVLSSNYLNR